MSSASPPVVSIPIASVLCLLNCVHMWVCRGAAGCSSLCSPYHHDGWDKRTKGLLPSCGPYQRCESHGASDLKVGLIFLMLGYQRSLPCLCPTPWDPKNEQVWTPWVLATSLHQVGSIRISLSKSGKSPGRMAIAHVGRVHICNLST